MLRWNAKSEFAYERLKGSFGSKNPSGRGKCARSVTPFAAVPASSNPPFKPTRGSLAHAGFGGTVGVGGGCGGCCCAGGGCGGGCCCCCCACANAMVKNPMVNTMNLNGFMSSVLCLEPGASWHSAFSQASIACDEFPFVDRPGRLTQIETSSRLARRPAAT